MPSFAAEIQKPRITGVSVASELLHVDLSDGRSLSVPLEWFPRLKQATQVELCDWRLIGDGEGIHWETLDEDISMDGLLGGRPSMESAASFQRWLAGRQT